MLKSPTENGPRCARLRPRSEIGLRPKNDFARRLCLPQVRRCYEMSEPDEEKGAASKRGRKLFVRWLQGQLWMTVILVT
jgi:hypothetical protein